MRGRRTRRVELDLADIQGNVLTAYGRQGFPKARQLVFNISDADAGRAFVRALLPQVTSALRWPSRRRGIPVGAVVPERPEVTLNLAFTFRGLEAMGLPVRSLRGFPDEFMDGMAARAAVLGDDFPANHPRRWDPVWTRESDPGARAHLLVSLNARMDRATGEPVPALETVTTQLIELAGRSDGKVALLSGHRGPDPRWQDMTAILSKGEQGYKPVMTEHFGFADGIGDPVFEGQYPPETEAERVIGNGALEGDGSWRPLSTGEFLLGYPDEAQEIAGFAMPVALSRNGTFFSYRKLHQNVVAFRRWVETVSPGFGAVFGIANPLEAQETLLAKMAGRWADGVPVVKAPTWDAWQAFEHRIGTDGKIPVPLSNFSYFRDPDGARCPLGAHLRRGNPRDMLDPAADPRSHAQDRAPNGSRLNNRRRILRRGLPYGPIASSDITTDEDEHGIVMFTVCASLFRQFEFVQQQWINYGLDFGAGNDSCPLVGNHRPNEKFVVPADPASGHPPFIADRPPNFVETRGGAYFFMPSVTALRMIGMGLVDPT
ncbi:MAG: hypothetical protein M3M95_05205 [Pseudomonadota bacterium]|nr:hypothetical protein [Pseudomonadota bacterium]